MNWAAAACTGADHERTECVWVPMPRPPEEIRRIDDELRRRERVHQRLRWERRLRAGLWLLGGAAVLAALLAVARLVALAIG